MDMVDRDKRSGMKNPKVWPIYQKIIDKAIGENVEMTKLER